MKKHTILLLTLLLSTSLFSREKILLNFDWKFKAGETENAFKIDFDDSAWRSLDIPHDFQIEQPWSKSGGGARGFKEMGEAWYRKTFDPKPEWKGKQILIDFEGIMLVGDVYFNGEKVGGTDYGYVGFDVDVSKHINFEGKNVIAVWCSTQKKENSRWYTGGGLFRDVHLIVKNEISVVRNGVYVTTPKITDASADVALQVEIANLNKKKSEISVFAKIFSPDGKQVGETQVSAPKTKKSAEELTLPLVKVINPQLWDCENPNLYTAEITLMNDGKEIDKVTEQFGIRTIEYSKEFGFKLNGKKVFLKGIANHHDLGALGAAVYEKSIERLFKRLKEFGFNHVRTSHNPYSKSFLRLADKYGILITDELYDKWSRQYAGGRIPWENLWYKDVPEWIKRDRNHPSVILWSYGNELQMQERMMGFQTADWGITSYRIIDVLAKRYDNTRPSTVAMYPSRAGAIGKNDSEFNTKIIPPELAVVTEISSFNYRWMDYQEYLKHAPDMIIYQSEATTNELLAPYFGMDYDKMVGLAYWGAVEYWGESNGWPKKGWAYSYFNHALEPFPQAYLIKSAFSEEPIVYVGILDKASESEIWNEQNVGTQEVSSHWNRETGKRYNIFTYTNTDEVELLLNEKSIGKQKNDRSNINKRNMISWSNIPYVEGKLVAIARNSGKEVARHTLETTGKAELLKMELENPDDWKADGMDLQYVKVYAVDSKGHKVPTAEGEVTFNLTGNASIRAVDNGDHYTEDLFTGNKVKLHNGFAMAILRAGKEKGKVSLAVECDMLKTAKLNLMTK